MANSNVRSSAHRAAGGWKSWGRVKGVDNTIKTEGPRPAHIEKYLQEQADKNDAYALTKAEIRATLDRDSENVPVTVIPEGMTAKKAKKKGLTKKRKPSTIKPSKSKNRAERRALQKKVDAERLDKRKQFK